MVVLGIDPSGSFTEGKGTTGWALMQNSTVLKHGVIKAKDFKYRQEYWKEIVDLILSFSTDMVVIEQYKLYSNRADSQINSEMETSKLIGYLEMALHENQVKVVFQMAVQVKNRFSDKILINKGIITKQSRRYYINNIPASRHTIDAIRHVMYYYTKERIRQNARKNKRKTY